MEGMEKMTSALEPRGEGNWAVGFFGSLQAVKGLSMRITVFTLVPKHITLTRQAVRSEENVRGIIVHCFGDQREPSVVRGQCEGGESAQVQRCEIEM